MTAKYKNQGKNQLYNMFLMMDDTVIGRPGQSHQKEYSWEYQLLN